jgi:anti-sigma factor RsiW
VKRLLAIFTGKHQPDRDALSALIDGALTPERASALESHVATCEACTTMLEGMRHVRTMLGALPEVEAPRSFKLRAADVAAPGRTVPAPPSTLMRAMPVLSGAAVIIFAIAVSFDVAGGGSDGNGSAQLAAMSDSAAESQQYDAATAGGEGAASDAAAPTTSPAPGALQRSPDATPPAPAAGAAPDSAEDATTTAAFEARIDEDGDAAAPQDESERDVEATSAVSRDDGDGNNLALRIVQIASAAVAVAAAAVGIRLWRKRGEEVV